MTCRIIIAGAGGQGIMLMGKILAEAAMREGRNVTYLPAYGAEVRGGTANCMIVVSGKEIGSPLVSLADFILVMNEPSFIRFSGKLAPKGRIFVNSSLVKTPVADKRAEMLPFTEIAIKAGNLKAANMAALGSFCAGTGVVSINTVEKIIEEMIPADKKELAVLNKKVLAEGTALIEKRGG